MIQRSSIKRLSVIADSDGTPSVQCMSLVGKVVRVEVFWTEMECHLELTGVVNFVFTGRDGYNVSAARLSSTSNAFETDNYAFVGGVPEPSTWALLILAFGAVGFAMRRRKTVATPSTMGVTYG